MSPPTSASSSQPVSHNWLYQFRDGFLYTGQGLASRRTARHPITLLLAPGESPFRLTSDEQRVTCQAAVVGSLVARQLAAEGLPLASINIQPEHTAFCALTNTLGHTIRVLDPEAFAHLRPEVDRAIGAEVSLSRARSLFDGFVTALLAQLEARPDAGLDEQALRLRALVQQNPDITLDELARHLNLSYFRASRLFTHTVGLSMRSYRLWRKAARAWAAMGCSPGNLTDIALTAGFNDSAHFSRQWQQWFGVSPSDVRHRQVVHVRY